MANSYADFNQAETKTQDCPILWNSVSLKETDHPKKTILLKTGNKNYGFDALALWKWMTNGNPTHPMTNLKLKLHEVERIKFYKEALDKFPEMTRGELGRVRVLVANFFQSGKMRPEDSSIIAYFADIEDFKPYMATLPCD